MSNADKNETLEFLAFEFMTDCETVYSSDNTKAGKDFTSTQLVELLAKAYEAGKASK